jgi:hypothetical protein
MLSEHVFPHALLQKRILCEGRGKKKQSLIFIHLIAQKTFELSFNS